MNKEKFEMLKKDMKCIEGGTKEACLVVKEYLQNITEVDQTISVNRGCAVDNEEFLYAVSVLLSALHDKCEDIVPEFYTCFKDCSRIDNEDICPGEFNLVNSNVANVRRRECPFYIDSWRK